jgi:hypothetical protein
MHVSRNVGVVVCVYTSRRSRVRGALKSHPMRLGWPWEIWGRTCDHFARAAMIFGGWGGRGGGHIHQQCWLGVQAHFTTESKLTHT